MKTYKELKNKHSKELENFKYLFFAFNKNQFDEGMKKIEFDASQNHKIVDIGAGGFIRKDKAEIWNDLINSQNDEMKTMLGDDDFLLSALTYELSNHEYTITYNVNDALDALGLNIDMVDEKILRQAIKKCEENSIW